MRNRAALFFYFELRVCMFGARAIRAKAVHAQRLYGIGAWKVQKRHPQWREVRARDWNLVRAQ